MKKILVLLSVTGLAAGLFFILNAQQSQRYSGYVNPGGSGPDIPENIYKMVENSCFHCHSDSSSNFSAKGKLNFSKWNEYSTARKISRLDAICTMITKGKMPKKKFVREFPDKALSATDKEILCKWTAEETDKLLGD